MDKKALESVLSRELTTKGFKKKASSWYRQGPESLQVVDLQKSNYGLQFYLNLCCVPAGMIVEGMPAPKEYKCPIRIRLTAAFPEHRNEIEEVFDLERTTSDESRRAERLARLANNLVVPFLNYMKDAASLKDAIEQGVFNRGSVNLAAKKHLGIVSADISTE